MTVKTDIFLFTPWFPHLALFQRRQRKYQDGSDAAVTLFQHPFHWDPSSCPGRGISCAMQSKAYHVIIFEKQYREHLYPRIKWSIQLPKKVNWERREVRRPTLCTALVRFVHFLCQFHIVASRRVHSTEHAEHWTDTSEFGRFFQLAPQKHLSFHRLAKIVF